MAGFGYRLDKSLALAMVRPEHGDIGSELEIKDIWANCLSATVVIEETPFDH